ncbi:methyltransferase domain-containing protein [Kitasatospora viridis]|uniref:Protein-L-isoaspartate O-methyltransferase n=1 Tax=Kitasatospora viridis TaxID=281105 RepID=A0A561UH87_9ACTN|nr:methyltransferase domain-containing protein [Kitasatospora viridis]TWF98729.1 protein-L-isoaspartate(D-aspartate) O-methyltransferase [Kitasatospora viridis]
MDTYARLLDELSTSGALGEEWRGAFERAPRSAFIPDRVWIQAKSSPNGFVRLDRAVDPERWEGLADSDAVVVTQLDDGFEEGPGVATSSASLPSLVAMMLGRLGLSGGDRVLDIGTGTGWTAGLLAARLGGDRVTTVEVDPELAAQAEAALRAQGLSPTVVVADGLAGWEASAPYDAIHSTAAVQRVPAEWVAQTRPGGVIVTPWGTTYANAGLLRLVVGEPGEAAHGRFVENASFMWMRAQRPHAVTRPEAGPEHRGPARLDPDLAIENVHAAFGIGLRISGVRYAHTWEPEDPAGTARMQLSDGAGSWASIRYVRWEEADAVHQLGPRRLWDEVESARLWWEERGKPELTRFGLTVHPEGRQVVWLDDPRHSVSGSRLT